MSNIIMNKIIINTIGFVFSILNASAYDFVTNGIYYNILSAEDNTVEVAYGESSRNTYSGDIEIPAIVVNTGKEYRVTRIGKRAFAYCDALNSVTLSETIESIGASAFRNSVLESVILPQSCTSFDEGAFYHCEKLKSINIPEGTKVIPQMMFANCFSLESIELPSTVEIIEPMGFSICTSLKAIKWSSNLKSIGYECFDNTAFEYLEIPEGITSIDMLTFAGCSNLKTVKFPSTLGALGANSFDFCTSLESIYIPKNLTSISEDAFWCSGPLCSIQVDSENPVYDSRENCNAIIHSATNVLFKGGTNTQFPVDVVAIGDYAMSGAGFESIVIPGYVKSVGRMAFDDCKSVKRITFEEGVESVGEHVFIGCENLSAVSFPKSLNSFGRQPFRSSYAPKTIYEYAETPPVVDLDNLKNYNVNYNVEHVTVVVPVGCKEAYRNSESWGAFKIYEFGEEPSNTNLILTVEGINAVANYILGENEPSINVTNVDINRDRTISIGDLTQIIKLLLEK